MATEAQINANRENGKKSTGPRTEAGKSKARFNARVHGLTGQIFALIPEDEQAYATLEKGVIATWKPANDFELHLVGLIAKGYWRLAAAAANEQNMMAISHEDHADTTNAPAPDIHAAAIRARIWLDDDYTNIPLYEARLRRVIQGYEKSLKDLQTERQAAEAQAKAEETARIEEAKLLLRLAAMENQTLDTTTLDPEIGFVFSNPALRSRLNRELTLERARFYAAADWNKDRRYPMPRITFPEAA